MITDHLRCDIFCRVIDNFGDAGVCWRLARILAIDHGWRVRLWIDDPGPLAKLAPGHATEPVEVRTWAGTWTEASSAEVVIEAFACELPEAYVDAMARQPRVPVWINLEYLSAEDWVAGSHGLPSPHPRLPLVKHFFFPGFSVGTGGLLRESDYDERRAAFDEAAFRAEFRLPPRRLDELTISLFCYPDAPRGELEAALAGHGRPVHLLIPGTDVVPPASGMLTPHALPFLPQARYDEVLWASDLNFVRGEDSFVRAQWAAKPFVWQIYRQSADAHLYKLEAYLARHPSGREMGKFWRAWNGVGQLDWEGFASQLPTLSAAADDWSRRLAALPDLAGSLVDFSNNRLK